jgi:hypothetical protein
MIKDSHWLAGVETAYSSPSMVGFVFQETNSAVKRTKIAQGPAMKSPPTPPDTPMSEDTTG